jgi:hypothetical protein
VPAERTSEFVAECFWPGVSESELWSLDARVVLATATTPVRYLGSLLMPDDEVVLCMFAGSLGSVRQVAEVAQIPFDRIVPAAHSPWPSPTGGTA